jgi:hypothetical protein
MLCNLAVLIYLPFKIVGITRKYNRLSLTDKTYRRYHAWMFSDLRARNLESALFHVFFISRRYILTILLIVISNHFLQQILMQFISSTLFIVYLLDSNPFKDPF